MSSSVTASTAPTSWTRSGAPLSGLSSRPRREGAMAERTPVVTAHLKCPGCGAGLTNDELGDIVCASSGRPISQCALPASATDPDDPVGARKRPELERDVIGELVLDEPGAAVP